MTRTMRRFLSVFLSALLIFTAAFSAGLAEAKSWTSADTGYSDLFDQSRVHTIDIEIADWDTFVANADAEEYAECNVTIDGTRLETVGIRAKGNTSLSSVASLGSRKYSFKIEFDHYNKELTYNGLDKLSLNNLIYDATMMKDYLAYILMNQMGVPSPQCSFVWITVNGEDWSLYLAVEAVEDSFLERYSLTKGELYKPDSVSMDRGDEVNREWNTDEDGEGDGASDGASSGDAASGGDAASAGDAAAGTNAADDADASVNTDTAASSGQQAPETGDTPAAEGEDAGDGPSGGASGGDAAGGEAPQMDGFMGGFGMGSSDVKLQYIDDDPESYPNIFDNAKTKVGKKGKNRLIAALKTLSSDGAADAVFTDEVTRYLVVHDFLQNNDSYTGSIVHNYYLYEEGGQLAIFPWDYNLAFGGFSGGSDGTSTINSPIDSPVDGSVTDRPLIAWIFSSEDALNRYHELYSQFISEIIESGWLNEEISRVCHLILPYVEKDPNSFYSVSEFDVAVQTLQSYCTLRGESIRGQLDGTIPSTSEGQNADRSALVDGTGVNLGLMGSMNRGGGQGEDGDGGSSGGQQGSGGETQEDSGTQPQLSDQP